ncbi:thiamine-phosphate synthase [Prolixibacter bellariivorans]|uniref:Thiamine-phosphate synthase n=1 Tax=Prolixibacter bellariivorans TaxID=314319 RepID=A0A5M4B4X5_9BACT|nr:thiamine phosphate synthase [Prolixibacter bellariivorans]GET35212.1 thiamine-phosphate synthase [Prolixibacter bellariivorans]
MTSFDLSLYLVTDRELSKGRSLSYIVEEAVKGGVTMVQLREKDCTTREFYELGMRMKALLSPLSIPLIINDRLDIALAVDADGLHIGQSDMPWQVARRILGKDKILGLSVETMQQAEEANRMDVDYIGISPVFATLTKTDTLQLFGLNGLKEATSLSRHPAVAIGGINLQNAAQVVNSGADGIAVVSAIASVDNPRQAARELKLTIKKEVPNEME